MAIEAKRACGYGEGFYTVSMEELTSKIMQARDGWKLMKGGN